MMREHYDQDLTLADMGRSVDLTPFQLIGLFKRMTCLTPHAFLIQVRLNAAISALESGMSIAEVALSSGFYDQSALTKAMNQLSEGLLGAELQGEDVRARVLHAEPLDDAAAKTQKGLRIFVRDTKPLDSIARRLNMPEPAVAGGPAKNFQAKPAATPAGGADGDVSLVIMLDLQTEVEMKLPGRFKVSPQIAGAIKAVSGVVDVQTL